MQRFGLWNLIKKQIIINSFLHYGISQILDSSQDKLFNRPDLESSVNNKNDIGNICDDLEDINREQNLDDLA